MIIYLYGKDGYRRKNRVDWYIEEFKKKHSHLGVSTFRDEGGDVLDELEAFTKDQSLFGGPQLGIFTDIGKADLDRLADLLKLIVEDERKTLVLSLEKKLTKGFSFLLKKSFKIEEFELFKGGEFESLIKEEAKKRNLTLSAQDIKNICRIHDGDTWGAIQELDKLAIGGDPVRRRSVYSFFPLLMQVAGGGSPQQKLSALSQLIEKDEPAKIFNIIAARVSGEKKKNMADLDVLVKSGRLGYEEALLSFVLSA